MPKDERNKSGKGGGGGAPQPAKATASQAAKGTTPASDAENSGQKDSEGKGPGWVDIAIRITKLVTSFVAGIFSTLGYQQLRPFVEITPTQVLDRTFVDVLFSFRNHPVYPIELVSIDTHPRLIISNGLPSHSLIEGIAFRTVFTNRTIVRGQSSVSMSALEALSRTGDEVGMILAPGSLVTLCATYRPFSGGLEFTDCATFEAAVDIAGERVWVPKPVPRIPGTNESAWFVTKK